METIQITDAIVTNRIATGSAFAMSAHGDIFVPSALTGTLDLGDPVPAIMCIRQTGESTEWRALKILPQDAPEQPEQPQADSPDADSPATAPLLLDVLIKRALATRGISTMPIIAEAIGMTQNDVKAEMARMHSRGEICRAQVHKTVDQDRASMTLWAISFDSFTALAA